MIMKNSINPKTLQFGKCLLQQKNNEYFDYLIKEELCNENIPFYHSPDCPIKELYKDKSLEEALKIEGIFQEMIKTKNKKLKFASVGLIFDNEVCLF